MVFTFSIRDFGHPKFLKSQFGHPVMKILAKSLNYLVYENPIVTDVESYTTFQTVLRMRMCKFTKYVKQIFLKSCLWPYLLNLASIIDL